MRSMLDKVAEGGASGMQPHSWAFAASEVGGSTVQRHPLWVRGLTSFAKILNPRQHADLRLRLEPPGQLEIG